MKKLIVLLFYLFALVSSAFSVGQTALYVDISTGAILYPTTFLAGNNLVIGTNLQAWSANLDTWSGKTPFAGTLTITTGKTMNFPNTLTISGTDSSTLNIGTGGTLGTAAYTATSAYEVPLTFSTGLTRTTNTITANAVNLAASGSGGVTGNLPVTNLNSGTSASSSTAWFGDGTWKIVGGTISGLTTNAAVYAASSSTIASTAALTNGQLLVGSTSAAPVAATITGTANQLTVTNGAGTITLSIPTSPQFTTPVLAGLTASGSTSIDFSGNSGTFKTTTGTITLGSGVVNATNTTQTTSTTTGGFIASGGIASAKSVYVGGNLYVGNGPGNSNSGAQQQFLGWNTSNQNWQVSTGITTGNGLNFTPSTAAGGATFTIPIIQMISNGLCVGGAVGNSNVGAQIQILGWNSGQKNWQQSVGFDSAGLDFTPSTAAGGATFTTPTVSFFGAGGVQFTTYGSGAATFDGSGNITSTSDARMKNIDHDFTRGLKEVVQLKPVVFHWNKLSGYNQSDVNAGFIAQDVQSVIPEAVGTRRDGYLTLADRPIEAALVNAVKDLASRPGTIEIRFFELCSIIALTLSIRNRRK